MKKLFLSCVLCFSPVLLLHAQEKPRLAVTRLLVNSSRTEVVEDALALPALVQRIFIGGNAFQIIVREEIELLLENQSIDLSRIAEPSNIRKLQLKRVDYLVTGNLNAIGGSDSYSLVLKLLDVSTGQILLSIDKQLARTSDAMLDGTVALARKFYTEVAKITSTRPTNTSTGYSIGDRGPAGGIIISINPVVGDWSYMEAATQDAGYYLTCQAYCQTPTPNPISQYLVRVDVGSGRTNTHIIIDNAISDFLTPALKATQFRMGGFTDWFLPSKDELARAYEVLKAFGYTVHLAYWTSSGTERYVNDCSVKFYILPIRVF